MRALVMSVVAWTIGAVISLGATLAFARSWVTPVRTPSSGALGVVSVLSTTTRPEAASRRTTSVNVPPISTASRQFVVGMGLALPQIVAGRCEHVENPAFVELVVADEHAVAMPYTGWSEVHLVWVDHDALVVFLVG